MVVLHIFYLNSAIYNNSTVIILYRIPGLFYMLYNVLTIQV